ncbi:MAG: KH domain-containing protein [bacterium]|nr:KH domain-containing protein [bacterium]
MAEKYADQDFLEFVVKSLVDHPSDVKVDRKVDEMGVLLALSLNPEDMGKIIGRAGNTAKAIRTLLRVVGMKNHARVNLKIEEPEGSTRVRPPVGGSQMDAVMEDLKL